MAWYDNLVQGDGLSDSDKKGIAQSGLLQAGLQAMALNSTPGVTPGQALSGGLLGGLNSVQGGVQNLQAQRAQASDQQFRQAQQADQMDQMQRRRAIQDLALQFKKPDGTFDMPGYQQALAQQDPQAAMELHQNELKTQQAQLSVQGAQRDLNTAQTRKIESGNSLLTQEQQQDGSWKTIATGARFAPQNTGNSAAAQQIALMKAHGATESDIQQALGIGSALPQVNPTGAQGDAYLKTLPTDQQGIVKAVVDGRYPIPTGKAATSPEWQQVVQMAQQVDPNFDAGTYPARAAAHKDFTSGKTAQTITALNTAAHHLDQLVQQGSSLDNSWSPTWNTVANKLSTGTGGAKVNNYDLNADAVADELAKVFAGSGSALADREAIRSRLASNQSPEQQAGFARTAAGLIQGKLDGLQSQADQGLGMGSRNVQVVSPQAKALFDKYLSTPAQGAAPASGGWSVKKVQ